MIINDVAWLDPVVAFEPFSNEPYAALLCPGRQANGSGWAFFVRNPSSVIIAKNGRVRCLGDLEGEAYRHLSPFEVLNIIHSSRSQENDRLRDERLSAVPFCSGLVGFAGYELGGGLEPRGAGPASPFLLPDMAFGVYDAVAVFNFASQRLSIVGRDQRRVDDLSDAISSIHHNSGSIGDIMPSFEFKGSNFSEDTFEEAILLAQNNILDGEYYQANISHQLEFASNAPFDAYRYFSRLIETSHSDYGAYLSYPNGKIISNSPERFFQVNRHKNNMVIRAEPIKGTAPRSTDPDLDKKLADNLRLDPKERAENTMIADLLRNDLSAICKDHSIQEDFICRLFSYKNVHHLVSRISGKLQDQVNAVTALQALFPCGSITGAPKIAAMKSIGDIEAVGRGPYCGAIGYIDDRGTADLSVAIRILIADEENRKFVAPVGSGITLRSDPQKEYLETLIKARSVFDLLEVPFPPQHSAYHSDIALSPKFDKQLL
ncbi:MAG: anthranilate synthase component I family protein [Pseudomonadota bacterium]